MYLVDRTMWPGIKRFQSHTSLYRSARLFGADEILRKYLSCPSSLPVPLSLSHGVDLGQWYRPIDINKVEPAHWCTNHIVYEQSKDLKPAILIPHPWVITCKLLTPMAYFQPSRSSHRLIVLPPPGPLNDALVVEWMRTYGDANDILLVKARGDYVLSLKLFRQCGFRAECLSSFDHTYYPRLYSLLSCCDSVMGLTASSLLFFSAFLGVPTTVSKVFTYYTYDDPSYQELGRCNWSLFREFILSCLDSDLDASSGLAAFALGADLWITDESLRRSTIIKFFASIKSPYYYHLTSSLMPRSILQTVSLLFNTPVFLEYGLRRAMKLALIQRLGLEENITVKVSEIDLILNGMNTSNFSCAPVVGGKHGSGV